MPSSPQTELHPRILVLGLGNDILGDEAVGLLAARRLRALLPESVDVVESGGGGLDLLDVLEGYDRAILLDSILTGLRDLFWFDMVAMSKRTAQALISPQPCSNLGSRSWRSPILHPESWNVSKMSFIVGDDCVI